jgi:hypothetical protein
MKTVRKRNIQVLIRLNAQEKEFLDQQVKKSGLPQEADMCLKNSRLWITIL